MYAKWSEAVASVELENTNLEDNVLDSVAGCIAGLLLRRERRY